MAITKEKQKDHNSVICQQSAGIFIPPQTGKGPSFRALNYRGSKTSAITACTKCEFSYCRWKAVRSNAGFFLCTAHRDCAALTSLPRRRLWWHFWQSACDLIGQEFGCRCIKRSARVCFSSLPRAASQICRNQGHSSVTVYCILSHKNDCTRSTQNSVQISMLFLMVNV